jgi:uncharacterized RDD family membrane protein YckC
MVEIVGDTSKARLLAAFIDHLLAFGLMLLIVALMPEKSALLKGSLFFIAYLAYYVILEALWSRTLGKYFQRLVVRKLDGSHCSWKAALIRGMARVIEVNPLLLGGLPAGLVIISTERKQRIGDLLAGTVVVSIDVKWGVEFDPSSAT